MADEQQHDVDALLRKNAELLGEVKALKAKVADLEGERDAAKDGEGQAKAAMQKILLDDPLEREIGKLFSLPWRHIRPLVEEHFTFTLADDGKPVATPVAGGDALPIDKLLSHFNAIPDLVVALNRPIGGGAKGSDGTRLYDPPKPDEAPRKVASQFGLR
jgi:hypothetical protein